MQGKRIKNSDSEVQRIAIDGKAIRAAAEKGGHIPYIISAYLGNFMRLPCWHIYFHIAIRLSLC